MDTENATASRVRAGVKRGGGLPQAVLGLAALAAALTPASMATADCTLANKAYVYEYWSSSSPAAGDTRCDWDKSGSVSSCHLKGWLIAPDKAYSDPSTGNLSAIVYLHGSGETKSRSGICEIANYLVDQKGLVIFMPYMRGVDDTSASTAAGSGFHNTGTYIEDWAAAQPTGYGMNKSYWTLIYMQQQQMLDVQAALTMLTSLRSLDNSKPLVDKYRIAIMGHSYGGALTVLAAAANLNPEPRATVDLSGAAMSWPTDGGWWRSFLMDAAGSRQQPMYVQMNTLENPNGLLDPAVDVFTAANGPSPTSSSVGEARLAIYSDFAIPLSNQMSCDANSAPDYQCAHNYFVSGKDQTDRWLPSVYAFLSYNGF